jgi:hypothetical protein
MTMLLFADMPGAAGMRVNFVERQHGMKIELKRLARPDA